MDGDLLPLIAAVFAVIAFLYGSVGLGGGSAYIAVMAVVGVDHNTAPVIALVLNLVVAGGGLLHYGRGGHLRTRVIAPLVLASFPAAFFAAQIPIGRIAFQLLLGIALMVAGLRMIASGWVARQVVEQPLEAKVWLLLVLGAGLGALAGITGIGGGIYLAPVLILGRLATPKQTAGVCAAFIVLNSVAGLAGRVTTGITMPWELLIPLGLTVLVFGQLGSLTGARRLRPVTIQATFGGILVLVAMRILVGLYGNI